MSTPFPFRRLGIALGLLVASVVIHALFIALASLWLRRKPIRPGVRLGLAVWLLIQVALWTVFAHLLEMTLWAAAYVGLGALPDFEVALYFSMVTYTTVGYGDVVLPAGWHFLAGLEGLTGILMAGWSTAYLFAVLSRFIGRSPSDPGAPEASAG